MPKLIRRRVTPTEDWQQLQLALQWPEQVAYELIRPIVLFGRSPAQRARETGRPRRTLHRKAERFDALGMSSLFAPSATPIPQRAAAHRSIVDLPTPMRQAIVDLKATYTAFNLREIATICYIQFGRKPSHHTVQRVLAEGPRPSPKIGSGSGRRYPPFAQIADPAERRLAMVRLHAEGWNVKSIAAYLETSRQTVHATLRRWIIEGVRGLDAKSHARTPGPRAADLRAMATIRTLQENPELGEFRIHAALKQMRIHISPRTCGRILALNRRLYQLPRPPKAPHAKKEMPFKAERRHQFWTVDVRYLDHHLDELGDQPVYCISILENYSRAILASALSRTQDLTAYLMVLYAAIRQHGVPEALVSDGGSIFKAKQALAIYEALGIRKEQIAKRQPWMSYIETAFNVQRRLGDYHFARAESWSALLAVHDQWVADYNYQLHWAHRERQDGRHSPAEVLGWVSGTLRPPNQLDRIFYATRFGRRLDRAGYVRFRHWRLYGEAGLARRRAAVWLYKETLTIEFAEEPLSQFTVDYQPDRRHLRQVRRPRRFETRYQSPQLPLWEEGAVEWHLVQRLTPRPTRKRSQSSQVPQGVQPLLFA
jgi:transposase